ncbi:Protein FAM200B [Eumeta japonica]|uniref:Protein FAM200B n=1 Tax=Eumeta variegata TaxID=151549 RepID=A0A4C1ZBQ3_EUMVA|nr:Protein FAM200B [Eumeta japonica]
MLPHRTVVAATVSAPRAPFGFSLTARVCKIDRFLKKSQPSTSGTNINSGVVINNKPLRVICGDVLSRESMKPSKFIRHPTTKHQREADKSLDFFERKLKALSQQQNTIIQASSVNESALLASYKVAYRVAKAGKPHAIAENLILPAALGMVEIMALVAKIVPSDLNDVLNEVIKIVNSIKGKALQNQLFRMICEDMGSLHQNLFYHTEARWLSKGKKIIEDNATDQSFAVSAHIPCIIQSLHNLQEKLLAYFPDLHSEVDNGRRWILNPFLDNSIDLADVTTKMKEGLLDLATDGMLKMEFYSQSIDVFWIKRKYEYPELAREALKILVPFATSYLCELTFSSMNLDFFFQSATPRVRLRDRPRGRDPQIEKHCSRASHAKFIMLWSAALVCVIACLVWRWSRGGEPHALDGVPGPPRLPIIGNGLTFIGLKPGTETDIEIESETGLDPTVEPELTSGIGP